MSVLLFGPTAMVNIHQGQDYGEKNKYSKENQIQIYEFITIAEENNSLVLKIKHFSKEMKGWENKDSSITFRLVKFENDAVYFHTQTYKKIDDNTVMVYFLAGKPGEIKEQTFRYTRDR